jgi:hypothetical protein
MWGVAETLPRLERGAEAIPIIDECIRRAAGKAVDPRLIPEVINLRLRHFEKSKDAAGCKETAEMWEKLGRTDAESLFDAACYRAVTAAVILSAPKTHSAARESAAEADRAMTLLKQAVAAGFKDAAHMKKDKDLDALRERADFQMLVTALAVKK